MLRDSDDATYDPSSSSSAGTYTVTPEAYNSNYSFIAETGVMHVNPYGPATRAIKPVLNCIERISSNYYAANFEYKNDNDVVVYIPLGDDNLLTGSGIDWTNSEAVPTWFEPGGGSFMVFFDGSELSWTVNSRDGDQKVSNAANANSSSTKCKGNSLKAATVSMDMEEEPGLDADQLVAYPNPVADKLYISMKDIEYYKMIILYDFAGRSHPLMSIDKGPDQLEIDMGHLASGYYFIRIEMEDSTRVVPVIKQ
ncbi:MAG: T9SS type A sorting domain-containing protein [Bacteroidia bacterium]|nr:MAG: T9SS type A sorting domain-containing protein [Bacteroidia bacterium]